MIRTAATASWTQTRPLSSPRGRKAAVIVTVRADQDRVDSTAEEPERVAIQHFFCKSLGRIGYNTCIIPKKMPIDEDVLEMARVIDGAFRARCL